MLKNGSNIHDFKVCQHFLLTLERLRFIKISSPHVHELATHLLMVHRALAKQKQGAGPRLRRYAVNQQQRDNSTELARRLIQDSLRGKISAYSDCDDDS